MATEEAVIFKASCTTPRTLVRDSTIRGLGLICCEQDTILIIATRTNVEGAFDSEAGSQAAGEGQQCQRGRSISGDGREGAAQALGERAYWQEGWVPLIKGQ